MKKHMLAKRMGAIALCAVLSTGLLSATAAAQGKDVTAYLSPDLSIVVDGSYRTFYNAVGQEVHPILYGGTTYLPIRAIGELMGKNVNWSQSTLTVSLAGDRPNGSVTGTDRCFLPERQPGQAIRDLCFPGKSFPGPSGDGLGSEAIARCSVPGRENV